MAAQSGCLACHKIGENGNGGPGPNLTDDRDQAARRRRSSARSRTRRAPMPSFAGLPEEKKDALVAFLSQLDGEPLAL